MNKEQNIKNMERCHRFQVCSISKCPLDFYMNERAELQDEERCILRGKHKSKRVKSIRSAEIMSMLQFIHKKNLKMP